MMKKILLSTTLSLATLFVGSLSLEAGQYQTSGYCAPAVYKVTTVCVSSCRHLQVAYDHCNRPYTYWVTVHTYKDVYSNGTYRIWTQVVRG